MQRHPWSPRSLVRSLGIAILAVSAATVIRFALEPLIGFRSPLLLHTVAIAIVAQYEGVIAGLMATALGGLCVDYWFIGPVGRLLDGRPEDYVALALFVAAGALLSWFGGQRRTLLARFRASAAELRHAHMRLRLKHEIARMGSFEWFIPEKRLVLSPELERLYGVEPGAFGGKFDDLTKLVHPDDGPVVISCIQKAIAARRSVLDGDFRMLRDGEARWLHARCHVDYSPDGQPQSVIGIAIDVHELKVLRGFLSICMGCNSIEDADTKEWKKLETYMWEHSEIEFSHGLCPTCLVNMYPEFASNDERSAI